MNFSKLKNKDFLMGRLIPSIVMVAVFIGLFTLLRISFYHYDLVGNGFLALRIPSIIISSILIGWIFFELTRAYLENLYVSIIFAVILLGLLFVSPDYTNKLWFGKTKDILIGLEKQQITSIFTEIINKDFTIFLIPLLGGLSFFIIRYAMLRRQAILGNLVNKSISFMLSLFILFAFIKTLFALLSTKTGMIFIILFILISTFYDMGGFFGGVLLGHKFFEKKLAPAVSPKKTWEGAIVGYVLSFVGALVLIFGTKEIFKGEENPYSLFFTSGTKYVITFNSFLVFAPLIALFGDLYFSIVKRWCEIKDFSSILKGHGGVLDRLDSIATVFCFWSLIMIFATI
ncbi:phosphatidate cytidylyltransferase [Mycoplasmopsis gallinacea]|uniref:Phosphatidate cytidylyltransferase n=1 Tax=Mycoplasmopsis gallinacea TaxID=29556 RepID=A0A6H0V838_9BACT|nr:phosphatidate cytidylyltransferase [Mycoplasmopsis gallinacea]QIW62655.1 hypothetical protein GOQ20_00765 [Mycoplasmopsis gallinacea]